MGARRRGRILAVQALYAWDINKQPVEGLCRFEWVDPEEREDLEEAFTFARLLLTGTLQEIEQIDELIRAQLEHWDFSRVSRVELAILRVSVYALRFQPEIPPRVVIDEAIDIAKRFSGDESYRFINGVLDAIHKCGQTQ